MKSGIGSCFYCFLYLKFFMYVNEIQLAKVRLFPERTSSAYLKERIKAATSVICLSLIRFCIILASYEFRKGSEIRRAQVVPIRMPMFC